MTHSPIIFASTFAPEAAAAAVPQEHDHDHGYKPPSPEELGGAYAFSDVGGKPVTATDFAGHWSLLFFGYSRCTSSCPVAIPKIVKAARSLRDEGIPARAVFVDIDASPLSVVRRRTGTPLHNHGHDMVEMNRIAAMRALAKNFAGELQVLAGTRGQISAATKAFKVSREHTPPRQGEQGHSLNHSTMIYFIAPDTKVAGYGYHDAEPERLVAAVKRLGRAYSG